ETTIARTPAIALETTITTDQAALLSQTARASQVVQEVVAGRVATEMDLAAAQTARMIDPASIRFSQTSVNDVAEIVESMRAVGWDGPPIDVVRLTDGSLVAIDNSRLLAARLTGIDARVVIHEFDDLIPLSRAETILSQGGVTPATWGEALMNRIARQSAAYRALYPEGSDVVRWNGS
ncbi:MAG: ParB N-terminal domain-containing protein, partial [Demequinaceae bacterium]|nr:ParB N-terminal domain-containing protein [Demequinaceae bacterium]